MALPGAVVLEREQRPEQRMVVASLFSALQRICADGSWELTDQSFPCADVAETIAARDQERQR